MDNYLIIIPLISTLSGFAIALLLKAYVLRRLPGILQRLALRLSAGVFSSFDLNSLAGPENHFEKIRPLVEAHIDTFLQHKLPTEMPMVGMFIGDKTITQLKSIFMKELEDLFPVVMQEYLTDLSAGLDPRAFIGRKAASFSKPSIRRLLNHSSDGWLRILPLSGAIAGVAIGLLQLIIIYLAS